jgi:serine/threonine-protein kinase
LSERYVIVRQLGQGGFGRTYLAEDLNRFREFCVLKEFSPQVQTTYVVQKAEELFEREASVLYKLEHPQIPRFRELFRSKLNDKEYLFLVQDYVQGETYSALLQTRKQQGFLFTEIEARQLLQQILPVLEYIHSLGVIHRDISPDNLILRSTPQEPIGLPILIDFGGVKQVAAAVASQYYQPGVGTPSPPPTLLGKIGYAPPEQMRTGLVEAHSDLYALAATVLVLMTGKQPQELIDPHTLSWRWRQEISLSSNLAAVLDKMLSPAPSDRYKSASQVLAALTLAQQPLPKPTAATVAVAPPVASSPTPQPQRKEGGVPVKTLIVALVLTMTAGLVAWGVTKFFKSPSDSDPSPDTTQESTPTSSAKPTQQTKDPLAKFSPEERQRKQTLNDRRQKLAIDNDFYVKLVNQVFREKNRGLGERSLSDGSEDEGLRVRWDQTGKDLLDKLALLSLSARRQLGSYTADKRDRWKDQVNKIHVGSRSLYDLGDAAFFTQFPEQQGKNFIDQPIGQVWYGFVYDKLNDILAGKAFRRIVFDPGAIGKTVSGTLYGGDGKVFIAGLAKDQLMDLKLQASSKVLLSVYSPSGKIRFLENSTRRSLSVTLPEEGFYEFVVVSTTSQPVDYQLSLQAVYQNASPTPTSTTTTTPEPSAKPTVTPSDEPKENLSP